MDNTQYHLHLKGFVGGADFDSDYVDFVLERNSDSTVNVLIDSLGGSLTTALSIAAAFKRHGDVSAHFVGMNASAATIASLGAKHISIDANAMYLVHKCSIEFFQWSDLNADNMAALIDELEAQKSDLDKMDTNVASMYAAKCKRSCGELLDLMRVGGWLSAQEALEWGFVDEVTDCGDKAPVLTDAIASALASADIPIPNVPVQDKTSPFARLMAALSSLFKSQSNSHNDTPTTMNLSLPFIASLLELEQVTATDNLVTLSLDQVNRIEAHVAELTTQVAELKAAPAASTQAVIDQQPTVEKSPAEQYFDTVASARKLFNLV